MELDFSDKIKELSLNAKRNAAKNSELKNSDAIETAKKDEKLETPKDEKAEGEGMEKTCSECGKSMSQCECEDTGDSEEVDTEDESEDDGEEMNKMEDSKSKKKNKIVAFLMKKVSAHNAKNGPFLVSLEQLMKVYARGLEESVKNFKPGKSQDEWAFARVNLFLKMASGQNVLASYAKADSDILNNQDLSENYEFSDFQDIEFQLAKLCCIEAKFSDSEFELSSAEDKKKIRL